jgi:DNA-binding MarR family transcriptional regulator
MAFDQPHRDWSEQTGIPSPNGLRGSDANAVTPLLRPQRLTKMSTPMIPLTDTHRLCHKMHMHHDSRTEGLACACNALRKASRAVTRFYDGVMEESGLSLAQFAVLRKLSPRAPLPLIQLAHLLVMDRTTLYRALKPLEREGWIAIEEGKGRTKTALLTDKGHQAIARSKTAWLDAQTRLMGRFGPQRWHAIEAALDDLVMISQEEMR